jgi:hypothetical protein
VPSLAETVACAAALLFGYRKAILAVVTTKARAGQPAEQWLGNANDSLGNEIRCSEELA